MDSESEFVTTKEAAKLLGCSVSTVYNYIGRKKLPSSQPGASGRHERGGAPHRIPRIAVLALLGKLGGYEAKKDPVDG